MAVNSTLTLPGSTPNLANSANAAALSGSASINAAGQVVPTNSPIYTAPATTIKGANPTSPVTGSQVGTFGSSTASTSSTPTLSDYLAPATSQTNTGATIATNGDGTTNSPTNFSIDNGSTVDSSALTNPLTSGDVSNQLNAYQTAVNGLATASGYSPDYVSALQAQQAAQLQGAQIQSNFYTGNPNLGDTVDYATGETAKALAQNTLQQTAATNALNVQALLRSGNIAAATALVQGNAPVSVSPGSSLVSPTTGQETYNGIGGLVNYNEANSYSTLQSEYPDANIPSYDSSQTPAQNIQTALGAVSQSPQYQAQYLQTYTTANGGTGVFNKLNSGALQANPDGTLTLVDGAAAALGAANTSALNTQVANYNTTQTAFNTFNTTLANVQKFMQQYGINTTGVPITNQIQDKIDAGLLNPGALAAYNADIQELRTNASAIIARGAAQSVTTENEATNLIPSDLSPDQLGTVKSQISSNGVSALGAIQTQMTAITSQLGGQSSNTAASSNPFGASSFFGS